MVHDTVDVQYANLLRRIKYEGQPFPEGERTGVGRKGVWQHTFRFDLQQGFPLLTTKSLPMRWIAEELRWFISGSTYERHLSEKGVDIWQEWATAEQCAKFGRGIAHLGPIYGHQWRNFGATHSTLRLGAWWSDENRRWVNDGYEDDGYDQLKALVDGIINTPASTRLILSGWNAAESDKVALPPCHTLYHVKCHADGGLSAFLYQRSCDVFLGVPFNIASYALLTTLLASVTGRTPREFVHTLGDAHVYDNHWDAVHTQLRRDPTSRSVPRVRLDTRLFCAGFNGVLDFDTDDMKLTGYNPYPSIKAEVAV